MKDLITLREGVEFITLSLIDRIDKLRKEYAHVAIGVYTDELFEKVVGRQPITPFEERIRLANSIKGVDWVFNASNEAEEERVVPEYTPTQGPKDYHVGVIPGTYDMFHLGHLENFLMARDHCDILIGCVNSDNLVWQNKRVKTHDSQEKRFQVVNSLKLVDYCLLVDTNDKRIVNEEVVKLCGEPIDVIFLGSDLKGQEHQNYDIQIFFTHRDPNFQKTHSSTYLRQKVASFLGETTE